MFESFHYKMLGDLIKGSMILKGHADHQNGNMNTTDGGGGEVVEKLKLWLTAAGSRNW